MTKKEMIAAIQLQEAQALLKLKETEAEYGIPYLPGYRFVPAE